MPQVGSNPFHPAVRDDGDRKASAAYEPANDQWACGQLSADGEEVLGRILLPQYLVVALAALVEPMGLAVLSAEHQTAPQAAGLDADKGVTHLGSCPMDAAIQEGMLALGGRSPGVVWWAARAVAMQQRVLARPSLSLQRALVHLWTAASAPFAAAAEGAAAARLLDDVRRCLAPSPADAVDRAWRCLAAAAHMEAALTWHGYHRPRDADVHLQRAAAELQVSVSVGGALGVRTQAQADPKAQLCLRVERGGRGGDDWDRDEAAAVRPRPADDDTAWEGWTDDSEVYDVPKMLGEAEAHVVPSVEQALLLCLCNHTKKAAAPDALTAWELAPYVDAVLSQPASRFVLQAMALLLKARHEVSRPRVRERALLRIHSLRQGIKADTVPAAKRGVLAYTTCFPQHVQLHKELAEIWVGAGMVSDALRIYEDLQLWDQLIACHMLLGKKAAAETLVKARLEADPQNPKLYNAMGDLTRSEAWYLRAWEVSGHKDARSQRCLARMAVGQKDFARAVPHYRFALDRNPLDAESWFSLGFCHLKLEDPAAAVLAFTRTVQLEPEHGEAWNNIGILHLQAKRYRPAKCALEVALKHKPENWQICDNFALAAAKGGEPLAAARAALRTLELSRGQRVHAEVLEALVDAVAAGRGVAPPPPPPAAADDRKDGANLEHTTSGSSEELRAEALLQRLAASAGDEAVPTADVPARDDCSPSEQASGDGNGAQEVNGWAEDAALRQRGLLESVVGQCLEGAVAVENPSSAAWRLLARFRTVVGEPRKAKAAALACFRQLQVSGWQSDAASVAAVAECAQALVSLTEQLVIPEEGAAETRREVASLRLQLSSAVKLASAGLDDDHAAVAALKAALTDVQALQAQTTAGSRS